MLQTSSQVVAFLSGHLGFPFASPAFNKIGQRFRKAVADYAKTNNIPWIVFGKGDDKLTVMGEHLHRKAATGCSGVAAIGVAQEFQRVWTASEGQTSTGTPRWSFFKPTEESPATTSTYGTTTSAPGTFRTAIDRRDDGGVLLNVFYKHSRIKQYLKDGCAMRIETVVNTPRDLGCQARFTQPGRPAHQGPCLQPADPES